MRPVRPPSAVRRRRSQARWSWLDLRLLPPAATIWAATLLMPSLPAVVLLTLTTAGAVGAAPLLIRSRNRGAPAGTVLVGCLAALTVVGAVSAARAQARSVSPLPGLAAAGSVVAVVIRLDDDPRLLAGAGPSRVMVRASVTEAAGSRVGGDRVLVFAPAEQWSGLLPGQEVRLRVAVRPAGPGDDVLAILSARSPPVVGDG